MKDSGVDFVLTCIDNTGALYANIHSFNRWYHETWGFQFRQRIYAPALLSLRSLEHAVEELDFVHPIEHGLVRRLVATDSGWRRNCGRNVFH